MKSSKETLFNANLYVFAVFRRSSGSVEETLDFAGTDCMMKVFPAITESRPITVSPPSMVEFA